MKSKSRTLIFLFLIVGFIYPQEKNINQSNTLPAHIKLKLNNERELNKQSDINDLRDTLNYRDCTDLIYSLMFGGQDVILQWFQAPVDLKITAFGINCWADSDASVLVGLKKLNLSADSIYNLRNKQLGYYIVQENGYYSFSPFNDYQSDTINWVGKNIINEPFEESLPFGCEDCYIPLKVKNENNNEYQWLKTNLLGFEPEVKAGEIIAVTVKNISSVSDSSIIYVKEGCSLKNFGWKYYASDRFSPGSLNDSTGIGWWNKEGHTFDVALAVEAIGCEPPQIFNITKLPSTMSTEDREVSATVMWGCSDTVNAVSILYKINDENVWREIPMVNDTLHSWKGILPGQQGNTKVTYVIKAYFNNNSIISPEEIVYFIFVPTPNTNTLLVFNGSNYEPGTKLYPQDYYFGVSDFTNYTVRQFPHDVWAYGPLTDELVNYYDNIIEITTPSPNEYNDSVIVKWLDYSPYHNYSLAGQEWLGHRYDYRDSSFLAGSFEYDQLGIIHSYNDVSYANTTGQYFPSRLYPVEGSLLCGDLYNLFNLQSPGDSLQYYPNYELGESYHNWIDGYRVDTNRVEVDMYVETRGIEGQAHVELLPCASHLTLPAGNKIAFFAFDPLALNSNPDYYWYGFSKESPQNKVLDWFGIISEVNETKMFLPREFTLYQNYPNPFNPVTTIKYSLQVETLRATSLQNVTLKIYDVLGREVATLVNKEQPAGVYEVEWDAGSISSGIYFYELRAGDFISTRKMCLIK